MTRSLHSVEDILAAFDKTGLTPITRAYLLFDEPIAGITGPCGCAVGALLVAEGVLDPPTPKRPYYANNVACELAEKDMELLGIDIGFAAKNHDDDYMADMFDEHWSDPEFRHGYEIGVAARERLQRDGRLPK